MSDIQEKDAGTAGNGTTDVEVVGGGASGVAGLAALPTQLRAFLTSAQEALTLDDEQAELAMLGQVLAGDSIVDILGNTEVAHASDYVNKELFVHGFRWQRSDFTDGIGVYMVLDVSTDRDEPKFPMTCGSKMIMAQVFALADKGFLPVQVTVHKAEKPTKAGYYPMRLVLPEEPF